MEAICTPALGPVNVRGELGGGDAWDGWEAWQPGPNGVMSVDQFLRGVFRGPRLWGCLSLKSVWLRGPLHAISFLLSPKKSCTMTKLLPLHLRQCLASQRPYLLKLMKKSWSVSKLGIWCLELSLVPITVRCYNGFFFFYFFGHAACHAGS